MLNVKPLQGLDIVVQTDEMIFDEYVNSLALMAVASKPTDQIRINNCDFFTGSAAGVINLESETNMILVTVRNAVGQDLFPYTLTVYRFPTLYEQRYSVIRYIFGY